MNLPKAIVLICFLFMLIVPSVCIANGNGDIEALKSYAAKLSDVRNHDGAGRLYDRIALHYENESDWEGASGYYILAGGNFEKAEKYESAGASYINAGSCFYELKDCDNASKYYLLGVKSHKKCNPSYDDTWMSEKIKKCNEKSLMSGFVLLGISLGMIKFASKAAFGIGFTAVGRRGILTIASVYFIIPLMMSGLIGMMRDTLYEFMDRLFSFGIAFGAFQLTVALLLLLLGLYTIKKWKDKSDISKKTFLLMALPCPVSLMTMFMTCAFFIITGMEALKAGLLVGGIFFLSIIGITFIIRKSRFEKNPSNLGGVMIFFGVLYLLSIVLVPAYLPVHDMNIIVEGFSNEDMIYGFLFAAVMVLIGFIIEQIKNRRVKWNYYRN